MDETKLIITNLQSYPTQHWNCYNTHEDRSLYSNNTPLTIRLRKSKKYLREKIPIALKTVIGLYWQRSSNLKQKGDFVSLQLQTAHFVIGANSELVETSFGKKIAQKLDRIDNTRLDVIVTLLTIYQEVIPSIINVGPITLWELFKTLCTGMAVAELNDIFFKASGNTFEFIQEDLNEKICLTDENSKEVKAWKENN